MWEKKVFLEHVFHLMKPQGRRKITVEMYSPSLESPTGLSSLNGQPLCRQRAVRSWRVMKNSEPRIPAEAGGAAGRADGLVGYLHILEVAHMNLSQPPIGERAGWGRGRLEEKKVPASL